MVEIDIHYEGELHCTARHAPSATVLATDAPVDNLGKGESFSPTDLLATSLGTCMATTMGIVARKNGWNIDGVSLRVQKACILSNSCSSCLTSSGVPQVGIIFPQSASSVRPQNW